MNQSTKNKIGAWLVTLNILSYTGIEINGAVDHLKNSNWDIHANFHALTGLLWLLTLFIITAVLLWRNVMKLADKCAWWLVTFAGVGVFGSAVGADIPTNHGLRDGHTAMATGEIAYWSGWAALAMWVIGMWLIWRYVQSSEEAK